MILPITGYGDPVLRKVCDEITKDYPELNDIISNMYETMYNANGVGLAAPQVSLPIRLFVIDTAPFSEDKDYSAAEREKLKNFKTTFINPKILNEEGEKWSFNEGCLSIPDVREDVSRHEIVTIEYCDENFEKKIETHNGLIARVIQHEYDHIQGILFTDHISAFKKQLNKKKLQNILDGKANPDYKMKYIAKKGR
jgi:peptide deformylase